MASTATPAEVIKKYAVALEWQLEQKKIDALQEAISNTVAAVIKMTAALEAAAIATVVAVERVSKSFESMHYMAKRVGDSVTNVQALTKALEQSGLSAESAKSAIENFSKEIRNNPGQEAWIREYFKLGNEKMPLTELMMRTFESEEFKKAPPFYQTILARQLGLTEEQWRAMLEDTRHKSEEYKHLLHTAGLDLDGPDGAVARGKKFAEAYRAMGEVLDIIIKKTAYLITPDAQVKIEHFTHWLEAHSDDIVRQLAAAGKMLLWFGEKIVAAGEWVVEAATKFDNWMKKTFGVDDAFAKLAVTLGIGGPVLMALEAFGKAVYVLMGRPAIKALSWLLRALGLGVSAGAAATLGLAAGIFFGSTTTTGGSKFEEDERRANLARDPDYYKEGHPGHAGYKGGGGENLPTGQVAPGLKEAEKQIEDVPFGGRITSENHGDHSPNSEHYKGRAFDKVLTRNTPEDYANAAEWIRKKYRSLGLNDDEFRVLDEKNHPTRWTRGDHIHTQISPSGLEKLREIEKKRIESEKAGVGPQSMAPTEGSTTVKVTNNWNVTGSDSNTKPQSQLVSRLIRGSGAAVG